MSSLEGEWGRLAAPLLWGASRCRQTHRQGPGAVQPVVPKAKPHPGEPGGRECESTCQGGRLCHGGLTALRQTRPLFQELPIRAEISSGAAACHENVACMAGEGSVHPWRWQRVRQCPPAPGEPWLCLPPAHQSDGSVSTCQCEGTGTLQHSGLLSQPANIPRATSSRQTVPLFWRSVLGWGVHCCLERFSFRDTQEIFAKPFCGEEEGSQDTAGRAIPDAVSTAFFGIQLPAIVPRCGEQLHGAATKTPLCL